MIWRSLLAVLIALAVALLPQAVLADEEATPRERIEALRARRTHEGARADHQEPQPPRAELLLKRLDANGDGKISVDEIPEGAPEGFKAMLKRADRNEDKVITAEEFAAAAKRHRPQGPTPGSRRPSPAAPPRHPGAPHPPADRGRLGEMHPLVRRGGDGPTPFGPHGARGQLPDPKALFARLDRDKDGKLSVEEFTAGMKMAQARRRPPFAGPWRSPLVGRGRAAMAHRAMAWRTAAPRSAVQARGRPTAAAPPDRAAITKRAAAARQAATVRREAEARKRPAPSHRAAPAAGRPATRKATPEARKKAAEASKAARAKRAAAAKKKAEAAKKRAATADKRKPRKRDDPRRSKP